MQTDGREGPFTADNWEGTPQEIALANAAYWIAAATWFDGADERRAPEMRKALADRINNAFSGDARPEEIARWALGR